MISIIGRLVTSNDTEIVLGLIKVSRMVQKLLGTLIQRAQGLKASQIGRVSPGSSVLAAGNVTQFNSSIFCMPPELALFQ